MNGRDDQNAAELSTEAELGQGEFEEDLPAELPPDEARIEPESVFTPEPGATGSGEAGAPDGDLGRVTAERDEYLDVVRRLQAEFENYRKRTVRQQTELLERAAEGLVERLLPVLDALDLALEHARSTPEEDDVALGRIAALVGDVLAKDGLTRIGEVGETFDPTVHEAVLHVPADEGDETTGQGPVVDEVLRAGYRLRGRVLRPAMVKVRG